MSLLHAMFAAQFLLVISRLGGLGPISGAESFILQDLPIYRVERTMNFHPDADDELWDANGRIESERSSRSSHLPSWNRLHSFWEMRNKVTSLPTTPLVFEPLLRINDL